MRNGAPASTSLVARLLPVVLTPAAFVLALLVAWEAAVRILHTPTWLVPRPSELPGGVPPSVWMHVGVTTEEVLLGFVMANVLAVLAAIAFVQSPTLERGLYPLAIAMKTTPLVAIAPLLVLWFGTGLSSKVVAAALISFFPTLVNTVKGLRAPSDDEHELFRALNGGRWVTLWRLQLPTALPYLFAALKISTSLAVVGALVSEFVGSNEGLGFLILQSSYHLDSPQLFVSIALAALVGFALFAFVSLCEHLVVTW